jgi:hypothetical protein
MSTEWKFKFPLVTIQALDRGVSDHTPLLLNTGYPAFVGSKKKFKFELNWLQREGFQTISRKFGLIQVRVGTRYKDAITS